MARNTLSTFAFILLIGAAMWFYHMNRDVTGTDVAAQELEASSIAETSPRPTPRVARAPISSRASEVSGELQSLQQRLVDAQEGLQAQREIYAQLNRQSQVLSSRAPASDPTIAALRSEAQIQNTMMDMDSYRNLESEINRRANDLIREQSSTVQVQLQQLDNNIRVQENEIRQTKEELEYWKSNILYFNEQQAQLARLNELLVVQDQQRELMYQQRVLIAAQALSNAQAIEVQKQEALAGIAADRDQAQGEVEGLRDSIIRLQQSQREIRSSQLSLSSQLRQAQQNLQTQEGQVQTLETAVEQKKQELNSLLQ